MKARRHFRTVPRDGHPQADVVAARYRRLSILSARHSARLAIADTFVPQAMALAGLSCVLALAFGGPEQGSIIGRIVLAFGILLAAAAISSATVGFAAKLKPFYVWAYALPAMIGVLALYLPEILSDPDLPAASRDILASEGDLGWHGIMTIVLTLAAAGSAVVLVVHLTLVATYGPFSLLERRERPDVRAFMQVVRLAQWLAMPAHRQAEPKSRLVATRHLEGAAREFERHMIKSLRMPSRTSSAILEAQLRDIGICIRSYQLHAIAPSVTGLADLQRLAGNALITICTGSLNSWSMRRHSPPPPARTKLVAAAHLARSIIVAILPLAIVIPLNTLGYLKPDSLARTAVTITMIWAIIGLLVIIDPLLTTRIQATKELMTLFKSDDKNNPPKK